MDTPNKKQTEIIRTRVESVVTGLVETMVSDLSDDFFRGQVLDNLPKSDFTDDDIEDLHLMMLEVDKEGGIDDKIYTDFIKELVNSIMNKFKEDEN